jgi:16S rRNA (guanine527-N7)-methyltransferase
MTTVQAVPALREGVEALGIDIGPQALQALGDYAVLLERWNRTYNLTAVRELERIVPLHLLDSLAVLPWVGDGQLLDVGSGGGLPGIPLALAKPALQVTLLDSNSKKSAFQQQAAIELGLRNVRVVCSRIEQFRPEAPFARIVSRAFSELSDFVSPTRALLAPEGRWLAMKGVYPEDEIRRLPAGVVVEDIHRLVIPGVEGDRHLVVLKHDRT